MRAPQWLGGWVGEWVGKPVQLSCKISEAATQEGGDARWLETSDEESLETAKEDEERAEEETSAEESLETDGRRGCGSSAKVAAARELLKLPENFSSGDVRRAYRRAALQAHPDKGGRLEDFLRLSEAYDMLLDVLDPSRLYN